MPEQLGLFDRKPSGEIIAFDLETQKSFDEVGGRDRMDLLRVSVACIFSPASDRVDVYREAEIPGLVDRLLAADSVIGFNSVRFDLKVLAPYTSEDLAKVRSVDLLQILEGTLGYRVKLDDLAEGTLGRRKAGSGLDAIRWWREGNFDLLIRYCGEDARITYELFEFGRKNGWVAFERRGQRTRVSVRW